MILTNKQFDTEVNKISRVLVDTKNARYFKQVKSLNGKLFIIDKSEQFVSYKNNYINSICNTSLEKEKVNLTFFCPCRVTKGESFFFNPIEYCNIMFYGAFEESRHVYRLLLKLAFNQRKSIRNIALNIKHLTEERILEIIALLNLASDRIDMDFFNFDLLENLPILYVNEGELVRRLISSMKFRIYEEYIKRPGRDDHFNLIKGIYNVPKNNYFRNLIKNSIKVNYESNSTEQLIQKKPSPFVKPTIDETLVFEIVLKHESGWTKFPEPRKNISEGKFEVDHFIIEIIKNFSKNEYLLERLVIPDENIINLWNDEDARKLLRLMKHLIEETIDAKTLPYCLDEELLELELELSTKYQHYGYVIKVNSFFIQENNVKAIFLLNNSLTLTSIPQYFENGYTKDSIFVPIGYEKDLESFFSLDQEAYYIFNFLKESGWIK